MKNGEDRNLRNRLCQVQEPGEERGEGSLRKSGIQAEIIKVDSIQEIMDRGVMMTPALFIDGESKMMGKTGTVEEIKKMLKK